MVNLKKLEERIGRIEEELFGFTFDGASRYLKEVEKNMRGLSGVELDTYCSRNLETMKRAEKCVGA